MPKLISFYITLLILTVPVMLQGQSLSTESTPNIILIMADDLGYGELGSYRQKKIKTPHLDSMAAAGIRFTDYYAGSTVCAPSREAIMTGYHTGHTFVRGNFNPHGQADLTLPDSTTTIAEYLKKAGYHNAVIGKWGLGGPGEGPNTQGFDYSLTYLNQLEAHHYYPAYLWENEEKLYLDDNRGGKKEVYSHDVFVNKTLDFIEQSEGNQPFFLYLPYTIPHGKFEIPDDAPYADKGWKQIHKNIAAMITRLDRDVGRIIQLLRKKGIDENTVVFFTSDNGPTRTANRFFNSNGPFRGIKRDLYEGGIRVPFIAYWPGTTKAGRTSKHIAAAWDLFPTIAEIAGLEPPAGIDGISFLPELLGRPQPKHRFLYWEFYDYNWNWNKPDNELPRNWLESRAVRYGKWKAVKKNIFQNSGASIKLYDLETDPAENNNVAGAHPGIIEKMAGFFSTCCTSSPYFPYKKDLNE